MSAEPHRHFHDELGRLKDRLLDMSALAEESLHRSVQSLLDRNPAGAVEVMADDGKIDALELEVEEVVLSLLALHQPVARDLRLILSAMKIANDLERVGDHAVNIAQSAERLLGHRMITPVPELVEMARISRQMLGDALSAFVRGDAPTARSVCARDDQVDALNRSMFRILITYMAEDPHTIGAAMELFLVSRNLERVADLATNIAEDVVFLVEGKTIKHHAEEKLL